MHRPSSEYMRLVRTSGEESLKPQILEAAKSFGEEIARSGTNALACIAQENQNRFGLLGSTKQTSEHGDFEIAFAIETGESASFQFSTPNELSQIFSTLAAEQKEHLPYLVFSDAHRALRYFHENLLLRLPRFGCIKTASTLLAEGYDGYGDQREILWILKEELGEEAPTPIKQVRFLVPLLRRFAPRLREKGLNHLFDFECRLLPAVVDMERNGVPIDAAAFERLVQKWQLGLRQAQEKGDESSAKKVRHLLSVYRNWGVDYIEYDGRMRTNLHPLAADSGRFSSTEPNLQQVPTQRTAPGFRDCFRASKEHKLIVADYAQIELRVAAHMAPCAALSNVFRRQGDPHRTTAATLTGKNEEQITPHERKLAKAINFGFLFGMGASRFRQYARSSYGIDMSESDAKQARQAFFDTYPGISDWHRRIGNFGRSLPPEGDCVRTVLGRRKRFDRDSFSFNAALNIPVQGSAAEGFKLAIRRLSTSLREIDAHGILCVHDEYLAEAPIARAEEALHLVRSTMQEAMAELIPSVPIVVEARICESWADS